MQAAFPGKRNCNTVIDFGGDVVLAEIVSGTVTVPTRQGNAEAFRRDAKRLVLDKADQVYETARNLLRDPQPANSPLAQPAARIFPVVVCGGQFPINPLTTQYITEELQVQGLVPDGPIEPLALMDLEELEGCAALRERRGLTLPQLLQAWRASPYVAAAFRNYLAYEYGGRELGRPGGVGDAWRIRCSPSSGALVSKIQSTCARLVLDDLAGPGRSCCPWPADSQTTSSRQPR